MSKREYNEDIIIMDDIQRKNKRTSNEVDNSRPSVAFKKKKFDENQILFIYTQQSDDEDHEFTEYETYDSSDDETYDSSDDETDDSPEYEAFNPSKIQESVLLAYKQLLNDENQKFTEYDSSEDEKCDSPLNSHKNDLYEENCNDLAAFYSDSDEHCLTMFVILKKLKNLRLDPVKYEIDE